MFRANKMMAVQECVVYPGQLVQVLTIAIHAPDVARGEPVRTHHRYSLAVLAKLWAQVTPVAAGQLDNLVVFHVNAVQVYLPTLLSGYEQRFSIRVPLWRV